MGSNGAFTDRTQFGRCVMAEDDGRSGSGDVVRDLVTLVGLFRGNMALAAEIGFCRGVSAAYGRCII